MSDTVLLALIVGTPPTIIAIGNFILGIMTNRKADVITGHVNSAAAASTAKIDGLEKEISLLRTLVSDDKQAAALRAQAAASVTRVTDAPPEPKL